LTQLSTGYIKGLVADSQGIVVTSNLVLARIDFNGNIDTTFADAGFVNLSYSPGGNGSNPLLLDQLGNIVSIVDNGYTAFEFARHSPDGSMDSIFGANGIAIWSENYASMRAETIAEQADGSLLLGGTIEQADNDIAVVRFCP
jgi:hypothetical protein